MKKMEVPLELNTGLPDVAVKQEQEEDPYVLRQWESQIFPGTSSGSLDFAIKPMKDERLCKQQSKGNDFGFPEITVKVEQEEEPCILHLSEAETSSASSSGFPDIIMKEEEEGHSSHHISIDQSGGIMPRHCRNKPDSFCYVCGSFTASAQRRPITADLKKMYMLYFSCPLGDQDKPWVPHSMCTSCSSGLQNWLNRRRTSMPFAIPMVWREPRDHINDCYFCRVNTTGFSSKTKHKIAYPSLDSAIRPVLHDDSLPVPLPPDDGLASVEGDQKCGEAAGHVPETSDPDYLWDDNTEPKTFTQAELNDLVRDLKLSKYQAELLASRLKQKNLLTHGVKIIYYRQRNHNLSSFFTHDGSLCYCHDINEIFNGLSQVHCPSEWCLFIDSSQRSLKAVLLHNGNSKPSIPVAHSVHLKESYENMNTLLDAISFKTHQWNICGDLKVIGMLMGMQGGFTKYCCFLCLWDSRSTAEHYVKRDWQPRNAYTPGTSSVKFLPLVDPNKIYLPPLHTKLGLMKNLVKAMGKANSRGFQYLMKKFPCISTKKTKRRNFHRPADYVCFA